MEGGESPQILLPEQEPLNFVRAGSICDGIHRIFRCLSLSFLAQDDLLQPTNAFLLDLLPQLDHISSSPGSSSDEVPSEETPAAVPPSEQLLALMDWKGKSAGNNPSKRVRGSASETRQKNIKREQQRRSDMGAVIEELETLVPPPDLQAKRTKLNTLQDAVDYIRRVQDVAYALIEENRRLAASMAQQPSLIDAPAARTVRTLPVAPKEAVRLFVVFAFLLWVSYGFPLLPWIGSSDATSSSFSRHILSTSDSIASSPVFSTLTIVFLRILTIIGAILVVWFCYLLTETTRVSKEQLATMQAFIRSGEVAVDRNSNWVLGLTKVLEIYHALGKELPSSTLGEMLFFFLQLIRAILNILYVGKWMERALMNYFDRREAAIIESRVLLWSSRLCVRSSVPLQWRPIWFYGCLLASASGLHVTNAPDKYIDEFHSAICLFDNDTHSRVPCFISRLIFRLAKAQLRPVSVKFISVDPCDWTLVRMLPQTSSLRLQDEFAASLKRLPSLSGLPQVREIANSAMLCFAMRETADAFVLLSIAVRAGNSPTLSGSPGYMPISAMRTMSAMLIICACRVGRRRDAAQLLPALERLHACVPDGYANIMLCEHLFLQTARIVTLGDHDYAGLVTQTQQLIAACNASGLQRALNVPFALEAVFERVMSTLQLAYDLLHQGSAQRVEPRSFVLHHRVELGDLAASLLGLLRCCTEWVAWLSPMLERVRGWHAFVHLQDHDAALQHMLHSIKEAHRLGLPAQGECTKKLMQKLGLPVPKVSSSSQEGV